MTSTNKLLTILPILLLTGCPKPPPTTHSRQLGEACDSINQCLSGLYCEDGICRVVCTNDSQCDENASCVGGRCVIKAPNNCPTGFTGNNCDICLENHYGAQCQICECQHGTCNQGKSGDGSCECEQGWSGDKCDDASSEQPAPTDCETFLQKNTCGDYEGCSHKDGTPKCQCVIYVDAAAGPSGNGSSWENATTLDIAIYKASQFVENGQNSCTLWLKKGAHEIAKTDLKNLKLLGGFKGTEKSDTNLSGVTAIKPDFSEGTPLFKISGQVSLGNLIFSDNQYMSATQVKGVLLASTDFDKLIIDNCTFSNNKFGDSESSSGHPGDICPGSIINLEGGILEISKSVFKDNIAAGKGALINHRADATGQGSEFINDSQFLNNHGSRYMGYQPIIFLDGITSNQNNNLFNGNHGGVFTISGGDININDSSFFENEVSGPYASHGGAISAATANIIINATQFIGNYSGGQSSTGGAIYLDNDSRLEITASNFAYNHSASNGGAIYAENSSIKAASCFFTKNYNYWSSSSPNPGGAIGITNGLADITGNFFSGNKNTFYTKSSKVNIINSIFMNDQKSYAIEASTEDGQKTSTDIVYSLINGTIHITNGPAETYIANTILTNKDKLDSSIITNNNVADYNLTARSNKNCTVKNAIYSAESGRTRINISETCQFTRDADIAGQLVSTCGENTVRLPIIENGNNWLEIYGDLASAETDFPPDCVIKFYDLAKDLDSDTVNLLKDKAVDDGKFFVETDIWGNSRDETPDIGPIEL